MTSDVLNVSGEIDPRQLRRLVEAFMDESHGFDPALTIFEYLCSLVVANLRTLQVEETRDHLKVVFHAMVDFFEKNLFFLERSVDPFFVEPALRDVVILPEMVLIIPIHQQWNVITAEDAVIV